MTAPRPYPRHWEADVVLTDGGTTRVRPIRPDDADRLRSFHLRLSKETVYNRFFAYRPALSDKDVARFSRVDHDDRAALVATLNDDIIGVVRYDRLPGSNDAEVAFVVEDPTRAGGSGRSCWSTWPQRPANAASSALSPMCCQRTAPCSVSSAAPATSSAAS